MFVQISKHVKVYITETQIEFIKRMKDKFPMLQTDFEVNDLEVAKILCDKSIFNIKKQKIWGGAYENANSLIFLKLVTGGTL